jgi:hypothetical protein
MGGIARVTKACSGPSGPQDRVCGAPIIKRDICPHKIYKFVSVEILGIFANWEQNGLQVPT